MIIIDPEGKLVSTHIGFNQHMVENLRTEVAKVLAKHSERQ